MTAARTVLDQHTCHIVPCCENTGEPLPILTVRIGFLDVVANGVHLFSAIPTVFPIIVTVNLDGDKFRSFLQRKENQPFSSRDDPPCLSLRDVEYSSVVSQSC